MVEVVKETPSICNVELVTTAVVAKPKALSFLTSNVPPCIFTAVAALKVFAPVKIHRPAPSFFIPQAAVNPEFVLCDKLATVLVPVLEPEKTKVQPREVASG